MIVKNTSLNNGLLVEEKKGRMFVLRPGRTYKDAVRLFQAELSQWEEIIEDITDLFLRLNTEKAELAATVHFAMETMEKNDYSPTEMEVFREVKQWKRLRRPQLVDADLAAAIRNLNIMNWLKLDISEDLPCLKIVYNVLNIRSGSRRPGRSFAVPPITQEGGSPSRFCISPMKAPST